MKRTRVLWALAALAGCGSNVTVDNLNPQGTVGGLVYNAADETPLAGVAVTITTPAKSFTATTDAEGFFSAASIPSGTFTIKFDSMGYQSAFFNQTLNGSVGNFPVRDPVLTLSPIGLIKNTGTFSVRIIDQYGAPAAGIAAVARTSVRYVTYTNGSANATGTYSIAATSGMDGVTTFTGIPDFTGLGFVSDTINVDVAPTKVGDYDFFGSTTSFMVTHLTAANSAPTIKLAGPSSALSIDTSNIDYLVGFSANTGGALTTTQTAWTPVPASGPIDIAFNQAVDPATVRAQFTTDDGKPSAASAMIDVSTNIVKITPSAAFPAGQRMNIILHAIAANTVGTGSTGGQREINANAPFFVQSASDAAPTVTGMKFTDATKTLSLVFSEPIGLGKASAAGVNCVAFYDQDFDPSSTDYYQGEWHNGSGEVCTPPATSDVTTISPTENYNGATGFVTTGFATHWRIVINPGCKPMTTCTEPAQGSKIYLLFNRPDSQFTVHRVDGKPVGNSIASIVVPAPTP